MNTAEVSAVLPPPENTWFLFGVFAGLAWFVQGRKCLLYGFSQRLPANHRHDALLKLKRIYDMHNSHTAGFALALLGLFGLSAVAQAKTPISWWKADGNAVDSVGGNDGGLQGGVTYGPGAVNQGFVFDGTNGVVHIPDASNLAITGSLTITADVLCGQLPTSGGLGQIFFRGDNRIALDPYYLAVKGDGNLVFHIETATGQSSEIEAVMPLQKFVFVDASLNDATGLMQLSIDNQVVAQTTTTLRPFQNLDPAFDPGIGIGNTQDPGSYNEFFTGTIDEVKVYNSVVPAAVPEASTTISLGLLLALGGVVIAAKRKKATAS